MQKELHLSGAIVIYYAHWSWFLSHGWLKRCPIKRGNNDGVNSRQKNKRGQADRAIMNGSIFPFGFWHRVGRSSGFQEFRRREQEVLSG
ncbi:MAG: hypothetical protein D6780_03655 [Candidatus Dadabacteria bacterium]|nr:MAG: hypothetical protein D6780_03655 [Candidatus Dadabacteria bacterium]